jgi:prepilin-type processing-associated H-X9-DG protein
MTLLEVVVVILFVGFVLIAMLLPALQSAKRKAQRITCVSNLKLDFSGYKIWEGDHNDQFPMAVLTNQDGGFIYTNNDEMFRYFQVASNQLEEIRCLICPADVRHWANDWSSLRNTNISYFLCVDATEAYPGMVIFGDRNVVGGTRLPNGLTVFNLTNSVHWGSDMHNGSGNIGLTDGSVAQTTSAGLAQALIQATNGVTSGVVRYAFP